MRDLDAEIRHYKLVGALAATAGESMLVFAGWSLAQWAGVAIAVGVPLLIWGSRVVTIMVEAETK